MNIAEMHINFRQYAQQMGMQNVRAILPEQIDVLLNQSIMDTVNQLIRENLGITNDRVVTDNSKIGQINAFRTLYYVKEVGISINGATPNFSYSGSDRLSGLIRHRNDEPLDPDEEDAVFGKYLFLVDMSIKYIADVTEGIDDGNGINTAWYPIRIIDSAYLADTLNDFVLKNRFRSPIACIYADDTLELYIDKFIAGNDPIIEVKSGTNTIHLTPSMLRIDLVRYPAIVKFVEDISEGASVDCDLPESMHGDIVKHAVDLYRIAVNGSLHSNQEAEQNQQRENVKNNYRNEGYQQ